MSTVDGWEERFDKEYPSQEGVSGGMYITMYSTEEMKDFIRSLLASERAELVGRVEEEFTELVWQNAVKTKRGVIVNATNVGYSQDEHQQKMTSKLEESRTKLRALLVPDSKESGV